MENEVINPPHAHALKQCNNTNNNDNSSNSSSVSNNSNNNNNDVEIGISIL